MNSNQNTSTSKWSLNAKIAAIGTALVLVVALVFAAIITNAISRNKNSNNTNSNSNSMASSVSASEKPSNSAASSKLQEQYEWVEEDVGGEYVLSGGDIPDDKLTAEVIDWHPGAPGFAVTYTLRMFKDDVPVNYQEVEIKTITEGVTIKGANIIVPYSTRKIENNCKVGIRLKSDTRIKVYINIPLYVQKEITFVDDFNGTALDSAKWSYYEENQISSHAGASKQIVSNREAVKVKDGNLVLTAMKKTITTHTGDTFHYITGHVTGRNKFSQTQGTFSGRFKFPTKGGVNSAFWMMPFSYRTDAFFMSPKNPLAGCNEIDIFEQSKFFEKNNNATTSMGQHYFLPGGTYSHAASLFPSLQQLSSLSDGKYHDIALVWTNKGTYYYFDGKLILKEEGITKSNTDRTDAYMLLTTGVASVNNDVNNWYGTMMDSDFPQSFIIDYIKVYK